MHANANSHSMSDRVYAVDLAKNKFNVHEFGPHGQRLRQRTLTRSVFSSLFSKPGTARGTVVMEACASSHHWGRRLQDLGYRAKLVPAQFVAKQRIGNKTDGNDADAIYAVHKDRRVRSIPVKSLEQQDVCTWHRMRERLIKERTQCVNHVRGVLAERGLIATKGTGGFSSLLKRVAENPPEEVTPALQQMVAMDAEHIRHISEQVTQVERALQAVLKSSHVAQQVKTIFGVGLVTATACAAEFGHGVDRYADCRQFAAGIGITPREDSTGESRRLGPITKRGNPYLRHLLVQCAQVIVNLREKHDDAMCLLARRLFAAHKTRNNVIVAIANRLARIIYAVIKHDQPYRPSGRPLAAAG